MLTRGLLKGAISAVAYAGNVPSAPEMAHKQDKLRETLSQKPSGEGDSSAGAMPSIVQR